MNEHRMQFAIGIVTIMGGFALAAIIIWFGEFQSVIAPRKVYYVVFDYAPGATPKMPVRRAGIRIGEVRKVEYSDEHAKVGLTIVIEGDNALREGDVPSIATADLLGDRYLEISTRADMRGVRERPLIPVGSTLEGKSPQSFDQTIGMAADVLPNANRTLMDIQVATRRWAEVGERTNRIMAANEARFNQTMNETQQAVREFRQTIDAINSILTDQTQEDIRVIVNNLRQSSDDLQPLIENADMAIRRARETTETIDSVAQDLRAVTQPLSESGERTVKNLDEGAQKLNRVLTDVQDLTDRLRNKDGTLQRMINDPSLFQNLDDASGILVHNLAKLEGILNDVRVFADKIARHPGELGVQGVLTRDTGLKTVPPGQDKPRLFSR